ncbi:MAG TPA: LysR family transcriptional regulator [Hyphomonas sp.]|nr:LysR family transcriptional regulator [Hyphomonas sp.]HRX74075.1 LysR family transcriptional regulator [Hyphomonas sp.]
MTERMDWDNMRVFRVVAELGSMNAAAHRLQESAPTISRKIDQLEQDLNAQLLVRTTRGVELTEAGRIALSHIHAMADSVGEMYETAGNRDRDIEGRIVLATGDGLGPYWIAPRLPDFHAENPKVQLRMRVVESVPDLLEGEADIAIQFTEPKSPEIIGRKLGVLHYMSFASPAYLEGRTLPNSLFEYYKYRTILHEGYVHQIERWAPRIAELKKMIDYSLVTNSAAAMIEVCANGGGIAVLPSYLGEVDHRVKPLDLPEIAPIQFWLTYTERVRRLPHGEAVLDWIWSIFDERKVAWFRDEFVHPSQVKKGSNSLVAKVS